MGRPLTFNTVEELQKKIEEYFESCKGEVLKDKEGNTVFDKYGFPILVNQKPLTVTGLALFLGFNSRQTLLNYQDKEEFMDTIMRAKTKVEEYVETRLFDKDGCNGAKFNLSNNFGWREKQEVENTNVNLNNNMDLTGLSTDEIRDLLNKK